MKLYATITSERASKGQGGNEYLDIELKGAHSTPIVRLSLISDGAGYKLTGWTHDNHRIEMAIPENMTKGERQKGEMQNALCAHGVRKTAVCMACYKAQ
ncbi:MAG: hypothetical protein KBD16_00695 [Candidatus Pacebacteria bacterium]|nr:hypothetical protein [Candidatus Paceibacterota bacterium]